MDAAGTDGASATPAQQAADVGAVLAQPGTSTTAAVAAAMPVPDPPASAGAPDAGTTSTTAGPTANAATTTAAPLQTTGAVDFPLRSTTATTQVAPRAPASPAADAGSIGGAVFSLLLVIGLILGLGWLARRMPGMQRGNSASNLKVVASIALGPRDRAVVLDVGGQQLLVGVGPGGVRTLHMLEHPLPVAESNAPPPFAQVLAQHFGRKS